MKVMIGDAFLGVSVCLLAFYIAGSQSLTSHQELGRLLALPRSSRRLDGLCLLFSRHDYALISDHVT